MIAAKGAPEAIVDLCHMDKARQAAIAALIFAKRFWSQSALQARAGSNHAFFWIGAATVTVLGAILGVPALSRLFSFATPSPAMLASGTGAAVLSLLWVEAVKWCLRKPPTAAA